jgi:hypothetical protein
MLPKYGGCKSWVEMDADVDTASSQPVLTEEGFRRKLSLFEAALELADAAR